MTEPIRVLLAEEYPAVRESVRRVLEQDGGFAICAEADHAAAALETALRERPDVCIIGLRMDGEPMKTIARIADDLPDTAVIVLTVSRSHDDLLEAVRAGASGYLLKEMNPERIPQAVKGVLAGEAAVPRSLVARLMKEIQAQREGRILSGSNGAVELTPREWEVLGLLADRLSTGKIAAQLYISPVTVRRHISQIMGKLGVPTREAAAELLDDQA
jgi:DNA-binding NarL/FixJ family response regulator